MMAANQARETLALGQCKKKAQIAELQTFVSASRPTLSRPKHGDQPRQARFDKNQADEVKPSSGSAGSFALTRTVLHRPGGDSRSQQQGLRQKAAVQEPQACRSKRASAWHHSDANGHRQTAPAALRW